MEVGEIIYLSLHCHHQNDFCIKVGSDESHFNVSVGSDGQSHRTVSTNHNHLKRKESRSGIEPRSFRLPPCRLTARPNRPGLMTQRTQNPSYIGQCECAVRCSFFLVFFNSYRAGGLLRRSRTY